MPFCELLLTRMPVHARKANLRSMFQRSIFQAASVLLLVCSMPGSLMAQPNAVQQGMKAVCAFHNVSADEVLESPQLRSEVCLVGPAFRVLKKPDKQVPDWQPLAGEATQTLEARVLASGIRPVAGSFTWLKSTEGWYVVIPSQERFEVLSNRMKFPAR